MARLEVCKIRKVSRLEVADQPLTVGRSSDNSIVLSNTHVSRHHCVIEYVDGKPRVRDLDSSTGTFLNGKRIAAAELRHGDRITVGPFDLRFRDPDFASPADMPDMGASEETRDAVAVDAPDPAIAAALEAELARRETSLAEHEAALLDREKRAIERETRLAHREVDLAGREDRVERQTADQERRIKQAAEDAATVVATTSAPPDTSAADALRAELADVTAARAADAARMQRLQADLETAASQLIEARAATADLETQYLESLETIDKLRSSIADWQVHADLAQESVTARTRELEQQATEFQAQHERLDALQQQLEQERVDHEAALAAKDRGIEEQAALGRSLLDQLQQAERQAFGDRERAERFAEVQRAELQARAAELDARTAELAARDAEIAQLRTDIEMLQQRLRNAEATKQTNAERAERAAQVVVTLRGQVHSLDEAANRITALQQRLAEIETAWVQVSEQIDEADDPEAEELEPVVQERLRMSVELDALNQQRDAAVANLRDSALRLRAMTELQLPNGSPGVDVRPALPPPRSPRRWWKRGG